MPYEHGAPSPPPPRPRWVAPAPLRASVASAVVSTLLFVVVLAAGLWRDQGRWIWMLLVVLLVSRPLGWLLWTRRRP